MQSFGYSGTPLVQKLGLKTGSKLRLLNAPPGFDAFLGWPAEPSEKYDVILLFCIERKALEEQLPWAIGQLTDRGGLWIAWPKRASKVPTDITENTLREVILPMGLVDNKVCAIDATWSGLRFVRRLTRG